MDFTKWPAMGEKKKRKTKERSGSGGAVAEVCQGILQGKGEGKKVGGKLGKKRSKSPIWEWSGPRAQLK